MKFLVDFIYRIATGERRKKRFLTPLFAGLFFALVSTAVLIALALDSFFNLPLIISPPWNYFLSLPFMVFGFALWFWSVLQFLPTGGTPVPVNPPPKLIQTGPYAHTRNPMLTGVYFMLFGFGFMLNSISLAFIFTPLFVIASLLEFKYIEEPELEKRLGEVYRDYKKKTPMLIPKTRRPKER